MEDKKMYVVKFNNGLYWCGYNTADKQIRKAKIYTSIKYAREVGMDVLSRRRIINLNTDGFQIVEVELKEKETVENTSI